jgi:hypothetical protein
MVSFISLPVSVSVWPRLSMRTLERTGNVERLAIAGEHAHCDGAARMGRAVAEKAVVGSTQLHDLSGFGDRFRIGKSTREDPRVSLPHGTLALGLESKHGILHTVRC